MEVAKLPHDSARLLWISAVTSFGLFVLNSLFSIHGYSADQHFQIIEFAGYKLGSVPASELAWEFRFQERQALQPFLVYCLLGVTDFFGISNPIGQTQILRILTGLFMIFCLYQFVLATLRYFKPGYAKLYVLVSFLIWYIPVYYVHFASETFSQALMLLGFAVLSGRTGRNGIPWLAGFIFGLAFFARFQSSVTIAVLLAGFLFLSVFTTKSWAKLIAGGVVGFMLGMLSDLWFYGEFVFTLYRYFEFQLTRGVLSAFGSLPFYLYFVEILTFSTPVIGGLIYLSFLGNAIAKRKSILFFAVGVTLLFLSLFGYKEFRFLLQILAFLPFVVVFGFQALQERFQLFFRPLVGRALILIIVLLNTGLLVIHTARNNGILDPDGDALAVTITRYYYEKNVELFYLSDHFHPFKIRAFDPENTADPFGKGYIRKRFYEPKQYRDIKIDDLADSRLFEESNGATKLIYVSKEVAMAGGLATLETQGYRLKHASVPLWLDRRLPVTGKPGSMLSARIIYLLEKS